ncbi:DUF4190 domain-containing protein [Microbacteriaceae bacterium VKM Ac-2854]|nr:DUF4190 domain-containing protein [Microbacteriaceae bacterium VKM Ac-2854]
MSEATAAGSPAPEWAAPTEGWAPPVPQKGRLNPLAVVSFVVSLLGLGLAGVVLGHVALVQATRAGERGRGFAIAGLVLGYLGVLLSVGVWLAFTGYIGGLRDQGYLPQ